MDNTNNNNGKIYVVYIHTSPNGKKYVGITSMNPPEKRWANGYGYSHNHHFTNAINHYGWENFKHEIIQTNLSENEAMQIEIELIAKYNTIDKNYGYNQTSGGEIGKEYTEEVRQKIREAAIKNCDSPEKKIKLSEQAKRQWEDEEYKEKMSQKAKKQWEDEDYRIKMALRAKLAVGELNPFYGKQHTEETKEIIREKATGRQISDETRNKLSEARVELWKNEEYRCHMTEMLQGENNPHYGKSHTEEVKNRIGELNGTKVVQLDLSNNFIAEYRSAKLAGQITNTSRHGICLCCNGKQKTAGGFIWMKKENWDKMQSTIQN